MEYFNKSLLQDRITILEKRKAKLVDSGKLDMEFIGRLARIENEMNTLFDVSVQLARLPKRRRVDVLCD
jgi:hypothetical protein